MNIHTKQCFFFFPSLFLTKGDGQTSWRGGLFYQQLADFEKAELCFFPPIFVGVLRMTWTPPTPLSSYNPSLPCRSHINPPNRNTNPSPPPPTLPRPYYFQGRITLSTGSNAIQWISVDKTNPAFHWIVIYHVDSVLSLWNNPGQIFF